MCKRIQKRRLLYVVFVMFSLAGCAGTPQTDRLVSSPPPSLPVVTEMENVPFFAQTEYFCGPSTLSAVLNYSGLDTSPDKVAEWIYTPGREGTLQTEMLTGTRRYGRLPLQVRGLEKAYKEVAAGNPVIVLQNLGLEIYPQWHYAALVGFDLKGSNVILRSGTTKRLVTRMATFEHTWERSDFWGIVIAKPDGPVPPTVSMASWLESALGLERVGRLTDAKQAYLTAANRWKDASTPLISAANIAFKQNEMLETAELLSQAIKREPESDIALNNLAFVLMELKQWERAEQTALSAIALNGKAKQAAKETLDKIRESKIK